MTSLGIEIGVAEAAVRRPMPESDVRQTRRLIGTDRCVAHAIDHKVMNAGVPKPAELGLRTLCLSPSPSDAYPNFSPSPPGAASRVRATVASSGMMPEPPTRPFNASRSRR